MFDWATALQQLILHLPGAAWNGGRHHEFVHVWQASKNQVCFYHLLSIVPGIMQNTWDLVEKKVGSTQWMEGFTHLWHRIACVISKKPFELLHVSHLERQGDVTRKWNLGASYHFGRKSMSPLCARDFNTYSLGLFSRAATVSDAPTAQDQTVIVHFHYRKSFRWVPEHCVQHKL